MPRLPPCQVQFQLQPNCCCNQIWVGVAPSCWGSAAWCFSHFLPGASLKPQGEMPAGTHRPRAYEPRMWVEWMLRGAALNWWGVRAGGPMLPVPRRTLEGPLGSNQLLSSASCWSPSSAAITPAPTVTGLSQFAWVSPDFSKRKSCISVPSQLVAPPVPHSCTLRSCSPGKCFLRLCFQRDPRLWQPVWVSGGTCLSLRPVSNQFKIRTSSCGWLRPSPEHRQVKKCGFCFWLL